MADRKPSREHAGAHFIEPMLCLAVSDLPSGPQWEYELKLDGYRAIGLKTHSRTVLLSRNGKDFTRRFQPVARALEALPDETVVDGEVVALDETGRPSFNLLQNYATSEYTLVFYAFDVPILAGKILMREPLKVRRELLRTQVTRTLSEPIRFSETLQASPGDLIHAVREQGLEGIVAKRLDSPYEPGKRSGAWVKMRVNKGQELVIGGYVPAGETFDAILVGYYEDKDLLYAAKVRNGFVPATRYKVFERFRGLELATCPFRNLPETKSGRWGEGLTAEDMIMCRWLEPRLIAAIEFLEWTPDNHLRHSRFVGLREDKDADHIGRDATS
jgi:DNA ligase D-like protein (predicted ligase)